ncbi:ROK family protein [Variovorax dokdonensis]|uniref:ROK family protein n=1 Tax=Variovorax dokdonensis TaxID=344883 RepID=A0ABT7N5J9_9BURK|nr:ROK family protein [Variovorax dokdonensis]MDM0043216.1 ROK family protein [Variovorax dokdonensis]
MRACVDVGGTKVAVSLSPKAGEPLVGRLTEPTAKTGDNDALARQIIRLIDQACAQQGVDVADVACVGVSTCGPFQLRDGMVELATPNICGGLAGPERDAPNRWLTAQLEAPLKQRFGRVRVENDGIAALEAERRWGALQGLAHCAYVTWSTGVGVGLCVDGRILRGKNGNAGHAGHSFVVDDDSSTCGCGNVGDVEALVAGSGVANRLGQSAAELMAAAQRGEPSALQVTDALCRIMGRLLYNLVATLDLERISLGGSVFWHNRDLLLPRLREEVQAHLPALTSGAQIVPAGLGDRVGDYAALALLD